MIGAPRLLATSISACWDTQRVFVYVSLWSPSYPGNISHRSCTSLAWQTMMAFFERSNCAEALIGLRLAMA